MKRVVELDGVRGVAIFLVLIWHYIYCQISLNVRSPLMGYMIKSLALTWSGVDLFFVLSGFLIVGILLDAKGSASYFFTFYIRRVLRIVPLYVLMLMLFIALSRYISNDWLFKQNLPIWSYFTFTQNFFMHNEGFGPNWLGITWSLAVEEQFYLFLPLLVWGLKKENLFFCFLCLICLAPIIRLGIHSDYGAYVFPFARMDSILTGGLLAIAYRSATLKHILIENYKYLLGIFLVFLLGTGVITLEMPKIGNVFTHFWLAGFYGLFILVTTLQSGKIVDILVANRFFVWMGLRSYGIYLFHQPVSGLFHQFILGNDIPRFSNLQEFSVTLLSLVVTFLLAELSFRFFESYFLAFGQRFKYSLKQNSVISQSV